ncbi:MAG TPA: hypothetical protein VGC41_06135 [Kofleriaceae bacterium]
MRLLVLSVVVASACVTPSIPIPPPDPSLMEFDIQLGSDGSSNAVFSYPANKNYEGATAYLLDSNTGGGVFHLVNADYSIGPLQPLPAKQGDQVVITIEGGDETVSRCVILRQGSQDPNTYCN